jgi:hypothetical protein
MGIADDIIKRADQLTSDRHVWSGTWLDIAKLVLPTDSAVEAFNSIITGQNLARSSTLRGPRSTDRVKKIYDSTGLVSVDRLSAGMESLVTPQSEKWHGYATSDLMEAKPSDEEKQYLELLRNFVFAMRYDPRAGFIAAHQKAMRSCIAFGTGVIYIEEGDGRPRAGESDTPIRYRYAPLNECLLGTNDYGNVDTNYRVTQMTARQLAQKFGREALSTKVQGYLTDGKNLDTAVDCIHAVMPRQEAGTSLIADTVRGSPIASYYVEIDTKHLISNGGFFEFPYAIYHWLQQDNGPYAESPVMIALSEIKSLQLMGKSELRAFQQWTDPPLGLPNDGVMNRPNLNSRAVNYGAVGPNGELRIKPIITQTNPEFAEKVMGVRREVVNNCMYVNLFQILIKNPEMTATEAMIRANEKGELLGPAGGKIQSALAAMADRELGILERKGLFSATSSLRPPPALSGKNISVRFTSPLDRIRRANEGIGIQRLLELALPIIKVKPEVADNFDWDILLREAREIYGAPASIIVPEQVLADRRDATERKMQMAEQLQAGQAGADILKTGSTGVKNLAEPAMQTPQIMDALNSVLKRIGGGVAGNPAADPAAQGTANAVLQQFGEAPAVGPAQAA